VRAARENKPTAMHPLSAQDILQLWEEGQHRPLWERGLLILTAASPDLGQEELAALTIGQRDGRLLALREQTFGARLTGVARCPQCAESLEFPLSMAELRGQRKDDDRGATWELAVDAFTLRGRLPNSWDLAAVAQCADVASARQLLVKRCVEQVRCDGQTLAEVELPPALIDDVARRMLEADPQAEILLDLACPACQHRWRLLFDIVSFFWAEIDAQARRLLHEVHLLARAYGWRESDILAMSAVRRRYYLEMAT
jgi:hypothetical protein